MPETTNQPTVGISTSTTSIAVFPTISTSVPNIEKLEGQSNYGSWKFAIKMSLMLEGLFGYVDGSVPINSPTDIIRDQNALAKICLSVKPSCYVHVHNTNNSKEAWNNLKNAYEGCSMATKFELIRKFFNIRQEAYTSMEEYINDILMTVQKLAYIDEKIEDKWISFVMRNGVSAEYESFVAVLNQQLKEESKSEDVKVALLGESERRRIKGESTLATALLSKQNEKNQYNEYKPEQKVKCHECGDSTHIRPNCPNLNQYFKKKQKSKNQDSKKKQKSKNQDSKKKQKLKNQDSKKKQKSRKNEKNQDSKKKQKSKNQQASTDQTASKKNTTLINQMLLTKALTTKISSSIGIIDSGATTHMPRDKSSLYDSKNVKTTTDVLYVPNLSKNLLSVNKMTEKNYNVVFDKESCKVFDESNFSVIGNSVFVPKNYAEVNTRADRKLWTNAMEEEIKSLNDNKTWKLVDRPTNKNVIQCKWVYELMKGIDGSKGYKARLVAKEFTQMPGIDFDQTFTSVVRLSSLRILFALSAESDWEIDHIDVTTAFLNEDLAETIYMEQPEGFIREKEEGKVYQLKKALYGLKQAVKSWNDKVHNHLISQKFCKSKYDSCVYIKTEGKNHIIIGLHVDDFYIFSNSKQETKKFKEKFSKCFKIRDLGAVSECLGIRVTRDRKSHTIKLDQENYARDIVRKFGMEDCKPVCTPLQVGLKLEKAIDSSRQNPMYQQLLAALTYLAMGTRPDICFAVSYLNQFNNCNSEEHYTAATRVIRYLKGTTSLGLNFTKKDCKLTGYADANYGSSVIDRSFTGYVFKLADGAVSWKSRKQTSVTVADNITFAEYIAISECGKESVFLRGLISELSSEIGTVIIFNDNLGANRLCLGETSHSTSKHIDVKYHQIREWIAKKIVCVKYLPDEEMVADVLTKRLSSSKHKFCVASMGMKE